MWLLTLTMTTHHHCLRCCLLFIHVSLWDIVNYSYNCTHRSCFINCHCRQMSYAVYEPTQKPIVDCSYNSGVSFLSVAGTFLLLISYHCSCFFSSDAATIMTTKPPTIAILLSSPHVAILQFLCLPLQEISYMPHPGCHQHLNISSCNTSCWPFFDRIVASPSTKGSCY